MHKSFPVGIYLLKVNNRNPRTRCEICEVNNKDTRTTLQNDHTQIIHRHVIAGYVVLGLATLFTYIGSLDFSVYGTEINPALEIGD